MSTNNGSPSSSPSCEPLVGSGPSMRTILLPKDEFEKQVGSGLWRISITARAGGLGIASPPLTPHAAAAEPVSVQVDKRPDRTSYFGAADRRPDPPRSIIGLPIVSCRNYTYNLWVLAILLLDLTYSAFLLPLSIGFQVNDLEFTWACIVDLVAGAFFAGELVLGFHVSYYACNSGQQREIRGGRAVARYYIRHGSFWQDAVSTAIWITQIVLLLVHQAGGVPMDDSSNAFQYVRIVRMVRFVLVVRQMFLLTVGYGAGSIIPGLRIPPRLAHMLNIAYSSLVLVHFFACLWNLIAIKEGLAATWLNAIPALVRRHGGPDGGDGPGGTLSADELAAVPAGERYVAGLYFTVVTVATLGYGDIVPVTPLEYLVDCGIVALGVLLFGLAMGSMAEAVASSSKEARQAQLYREKMQSVDAFLHSSSISRPLKQRIRTYYSDVWVRHAASQANVAEQFLELPHALRQEVAWEINRRLLTRLSLFRELSEGQRKALSGMLLPVDLAPGQELCLHGDPADRFWLLHAGEVQVFDECGILRVVTAPAVLGVEALLQHVDTACAIRPHGYRTSTACTLWEAEMESLLPYLLENTGVLDALSSRAQAQREAEQEQAASIGISACHCQWQQPPGGPQPAAPSPGHGMEAGVGVGVGQPAAGGMGSDLGSHCPPGGLPREQQGTESVSAGAEAGPMWQGPGTLARTTASSYANAEDSPAEDVLPQSPNAQAAGSGWQPAGIMPWQGLQAGGSMAGDPAAPASKGEVQQLSQDIVRRLDGLGEEMRRVLAAAGLAVALGSRPAGAGAHHRARARGGSTQEAARSRRMHWSYGQLSS